MIDEQSQEQAEEGTQSRRAIRLVDEDRAAFFYANSVIVRMSPWDILPDFGQTRDATKEELIIQQQARIAMSPQHAKVMARIFSEKVQEYERLYGQIPGPRPMETGDER